MDASIECLFIELQSTAIEGGSISVTLKFLILTEGWVDGCEVGCMEGTDVGSNIG